MIEPKLTDEKIDRLLAQGKSKAEVARICGVTRSAVTNRLRRRNLQKVRSYVTQQATDSSVAKSLNAVQQLEKINQYANEILDLVMRWIRGDDEAIRTLEVQVQELSRKKKGGKIGKEILKDLKKFKNPHEVALRAMGEIREQINLQLQIMKTLYSFQAIEEFQRIVLDAIKSIDPGLRDRIVQELVRQRLLRSPDFGS